MLTATQTLESCSTVFDKEIAHLLNYAKTKLLTEIPRQLKTAPYLRLCCIAIRKLHQKPELSTKNSVGEAFDDSYSHLLQALYTHNPEWYEHCRISDHGTLKSDDPAIDKLLRPLKYFIEVYACEYSSN